MGLYSQMKQAINLRAPTFYAAGANSLWKYLDENPIPELNELVTFLDTRNKWETVFSKTRQSFVVDSSAFSIFTRGVDVTLDDYIAYLRKVYDKFGTIDEGGKLAWAAGLDVIGDPVKGDENQLKMEAAGLPVVPCFHRGDPIDFLERYLERKTPRVALGGMAIAEEYTSAESLFPFLDAVFRKICDKDGKPRMKTHLFGIGAPKAIMRYPCTSYDSTHWAQPSWFGSVMIPKFKIGEPDWFESMIKIPVSNESQLYRKPDAHYKSMRPPIQQAIRNFVGSFGFEVEKLAESYEHRNLWNLKMALEVNKRLPEKTTFDHMDELDFNFL